MWSSEAEGRVRDAIRRVEAKTSGELVVCALPRSSEYSGVRAFVSSLLGAGAAAEFGTAFELGPVAIALVGLGAAWVTFWLLRFPALLRWLVPELQLKAQVEERAQQAFLTLGVTETAERSGVLLFLSRAERRVVLLADRGIHARVPQSDWDADVDTLTQSLARGEAEQGLLAAIERIGSRLAREFPIQTGDKNELPDEPYLR